MSEHRKPPSMRTKVLAIGGAIALAIGIGGFGLANADSSTITNKEDALAALNHAQADIDAVKAYLNGTTNPPAQDVTISATVINADQVKVDWTTTRTDITGWTIGRDGDDDVEPGPWSTDVAATVRTQTFDLLIGTYNYTFTLVGHTATGDLPAVTVQATPGSGTGTTTVPPTGTTTPTTTPAPPTTTPPSNTTEAAVKYGWGTPIAAASDEFNYTGAPNSTKWDTAGANPCWPGHDSNGQRCAGRSTVDGSSLVQTGLSNGDSAWLASKFNQQYGRWEARVKSFNTGTSGNQYHPLLIIWPQSDRWPEDGEYDFLENGGPGQACAEGWLHYPHPASSAVQQEHAQETNCGAALSEWHNVAIDWQPTGLKGYIDGNLWFSFANGAGPAGRSNIQAMPSGHLTIQLDNFFGSGMRAATYQVDWVRTYDN